MANSSDKKITPKVLPDWEAIERLYRAGQLSIREIGRQHGVSDTAIRKQAKKSGWQRSLAEQVRKVVREKLVRTVSSQSHANDAEIVEEAANQCVAVVQIHRQDIARLREVEQRLLAELGDEKNPPKKLYITQYQGEIVSKEVGLTVTERASAVQALAATQHKRIVLERQAFNLDDDNGDAKELKVQITQTDTACL